MQIFYSRPPPDPPPCINHPLSFKSLILTEPPEPPDPPDANVIPALIPFVDEFHNPSPQTAFQVVDLESGVPAMAFGSTGVVVSCVFTCKELSSTVCSWLLLTGSTSSNVAARSNNLIFVLLIATLGFLISYSTPPPLAFAQTSSLKTPPMVVTKNSVGGGSPVSTSDTFLAYGLLSPVIYRSLCGNIYGFQAGPLTFLPILFVSIYITLARSSAVCSPLTGYMPVVDVGSNLPSTFVAMALAMIGNSLLLWQLGLKRLKLCAATVRNVSASGMPYGGVNKLETVIVAELNACVMTSAL
ncbi:unnamed protein product [Eruca vesicaria subsp. sativa]|uniref:Uncharacterized protein n=1 Tax=Eruca vesicaria subsp. sativa TaxID=29727 RepID=A0ABC8M859_ERUVS|nr:unnamed protein product [Eruca vesicaria subsp. sativa]